MTTPDDFIDTFTRFLREVVDQHVSASRTGALTALVDEHLGADSRGSAVVTERLTRARLVDADVALDLLDPGARVVGVAGHVGDAGLGDILRGERGPLDVGPVAYVSSAVGPGRERQVVATGLRLMRIGTEPVAVLQRDAHEEWGRPQPTIEVVAVDPATSGMFLSLLRTTMREHSVLRGQVLSFDHDEYGDSLGGVVFHERPTVDAAQVVLPDGTLERLERHAVRLGRHREQMLRAGQHLKRGILLYGPPGTGKTHTVRHLLGLIPESTAILLSGNTLGFVREATKLARAMEPAIVVLEDCDLVAEDRDMVDSPDSMLFELLEALDGLDGDADVAFLMTTNRPDLLERALTQRPGRVDLAVEVPLPDAAARRRLFELYAQGQSFSAESVHAAAERADGVTASFARELVRRAVLISVLAEREQRDADLQEALDDLLSDRESLTRSLLASGPSQFDDSLGEDSEEGFDEDW